MTSSKEARRARALARKAREEQDLPPEDNEGGEFFHTSRFKDVNGLLDELEKDNWGDPFKRFDTRSWGGEE